jgi:hypothetical protein
VKLLKKLVVPGGVAGALVIACSACCAPLVVPVVAVLGTVGLGVVAVRRRFWSGKIAQDDASCACPAVCADKRR